MTSKRKPSGRRPAVPDRTPLEAVSTIAACVAEARPEVGQISLSRGEWGECVLFAYAEGSAPIPAEQLHDRPEVTTPIRLELSGLSWEAFARRFSGSDAQAGIQEDEDGPAAILLDLAKVGGRADEEVVEKVRNALQEAASAPETDDEVAEAQEPEDEPESPQEGICVTFSGRIDGEGAQELLDLIEREIARRAARSDVPARIDARIDGDTDLSRFSRGPGVRVKVCRG